MNIFCSKGHKNTKFLQAEKFSLLIETALHAILDGYYREAVSSISSGLERFYEFTLKIVFEKRSIPQDIFEKAWAEVSAQSERQFGAFVFLYTSEFGHVPPSLTNNERNFRNAVIHKGKFPNRDETIKYCKRIIEIANVILIALKRNAQQTIYNYSYDEHETAMKMLGEKKADPFTYMLHPYFSINHINNVYEDMTLDEYLIYLEENRYKKHGT